MPHRTTDGEDWCKFKRGTKDTATNEVRRRPHSHQSSSPPY